jgi:hypothetical protein
VPAPGIPAGDSGSLLDLSMTGPSDGWVVGFVISSTDAKFRPLTARWDGHRWRAVAVPPVARVDARLNGVDALSASDVWAVGDSPSGTTAPLILHWNGHHWSPVRSAPVPGFDVTGLISVAAHSPDDIWAAGDASNGTTQTSRTVIEHWNGHRWSLIASPDLGKFSFLTGITVASDGSVWAVGGSDDRTGTFILRWTGNAWVRAKVPPVARNVDVDLQSVTAVSPRQVWAVGDMTVGSSAPHPYALRWNGRAWSSVKVPDPRPQVHDLRMASVAAFGHGQLAAVGYTAGQTVLKAVYSRWNGRSWSVVLGSVQGAVPAAVTTDGRRLWAVGSREVSAQKFVPFVQVSG